MVGHRDLLSVAGRTALVTGVGPGIGRAIAEGLAEAGANIVISARNAERIEQLAAQIRAQGGSCTAVAADVSKAEDIIRLVDRAHQVFGPVDILINSAASPGGTLQQPNLDLTVAEWERAFAVNVLAPFTLISSLAADLRRNSSGSVVNVLSTSGFTPMSGSSSAAYGSTKAALAMLTRYLAKEMAPAVRVNALCPGTILADDNQEEHPAWARLRASIAMKRLGSANEIIAPMLFLASDASSFITGQTIFVDGGRVNTVA